MGRRSPQTHHSKMELLPIPLAFVTSFHVAAVAGALYVPITSTGMAAFGTMYLLTGLGITVGYHRLWSHRSYKGHLLWRLWWAFWGSGALQGSILWWSKLHRLHHSFPDTPIDPYSAVKGFLHSHCLWMFEKVDRTEDLKRVNVSDLKQDPIVVYQHKHYVWLSLLVAFVAPMLMFRGAFLQVLIYGVFWARLFTWHSTWCVNSLAHWLGENNYDDEITAKDNFITALVTFGEGNHGFHHAFSYSYQNGLRWYDYDPTRRVIEVGSLVGLAYDLRHPDENQIKKARYLVDAGRLEKKRQDIVWPDPAVEDVEITEEEYLAARKEGKMWISLNGKVYDVTEYLQNHPGGALLLKSMASRTPTEIEQVVARLHMHSKAARNKMSELLIGRLSNPKIEEISPEA